MELGIDFGTTRTVVACADRGNYPCVGFENGDGDPLEWFPSVVAARGGEVRYGLEADELGNVAGWTVLRSFKRLISGPDAVPDRVVQIGDTRITVFQILVGFLGALRVAIATRSNAPRTRGDRTMTAAVGVPANAHGTQRFLTLEAFRAAGFEVSALLNEPSAAGFEYTHRYAKTFSARRRDIVVYDLGGGTFDASRIATTGRRHEVRRAVGINQLGGDDFDIVLTNQVLVALGLERSALAPADLARLVESCRDAKERLNANSRRVLVELPAELATQTGESEVAIPVSDYYKACAPLVERTIEVLAPLVDDGSEASGTADEAQGEVAGIYVVGGASALPVITRGLRDRWGHRVHRSPYPFAATAIGLALALDPERGYELHDRLSRHFGVFREARDGQEISFDTILGPDTPLPSLGGDPVVHRRVYRPAHNLGHFRFAECASVDLGGTPRGDITPYADLWFPFDGGLREPGRDLGRVPITRLRNAGPLIEERYSLDANGLVRVTVTDLDVGFRREYALGAT